MLLKQSQLENQRLKIEIQQNTNINEKLEQSLKLANEQLEILTESSQAVDKVVEIRNQRIKELEEQLINLPNICQDNQELTNDVNILADQNNQLTDIIQNLQEQMQKKEIGKQELSTNVQKCKDQLQLIETNKTKQIRKIKFLEIENQKLVSLTETQKQQIQYLENLGTKFQVANEQIKSLETQMNQNQMNSQKITNILNSQNEGLKDEIEKSYVNLQKQESIIQQLSQQKDDCQQSIQIMNVEKAKSFKIIQSQENGIQNKKQQVTELQNKLKLLTQEAQLLTEQNKDYFMELDNKIQELDKQKIKYVNTLKEKEQLESDLQNVNLQVQNIKYEFQEQAKVIEDNMLELQKMNEEKRDMNTEITSLGNQITMNNQKINNLEYETSGQVKMLHENAELISNLQTELQKITQQYQQKLQECLEFKQTKATIQKQAKRIENFQQKTKNLEQKTKNLESTNREQLDQNKELIALLEEKMQFIVEKERQIKSSMNQILEITTAKEKEYKQNMNKILKLNEELKEKDKIFYQDKQNIQTQMQQQINQIEKRYESQIHSLDLESSQKQSELLKEMHQLKIMLAEKDEEISLSVNQAIQGVEKHYQALINKKEKTIYQQTLELTKQKETIDQRIQEKLGLQHLIQSKETELKKNKALNGQLHSQLEQLQEALNTQEMYVEQSQSYSKQYEDKILILLKENRKLSKLNDQKIVDLRKLEEFLEFKPRISTSKKQSFKYNQLKGKIGKIQQQLEKSLQSCKQEVSTLKSQNKEMKNKLNVKENQLGELLQEYEQFIHKYNEVAKKLEFLEQQQQPQNPQNNNTNEQQEVQQEDYQQQKQKDNFQKFELEKANQLNQISLLQEEKNYLTGQMKSLVAKIEEIDNHNQILLKENKRLAQSNIDKAKNISNLSMRQSQITQSIIQEQQSGLPTIFENQEDENEKIKMLMSELKKVYELLDMRKLENEKLQIQNQELIRQLKELKEKLIFKSDKLRLLEGEFDNLVNREEQGLNVIQKMEELERVQKQYEKALHEMEMEKQQKQNMSKK